MNNKLSDEDIKLFRWLVDDEKCKYPHIASKSEVMLKERVLLELLEYREAESKPVYWEIAGNLFSTKEEALKPGFSGTPYPLYESPVLSQPIESKPVVWWTGPTPDCELPSTHDHETGSHYIPLYTSPVPGWISVNDRLPELGIDVQIYCSDSGEQMVAYRISDNEFSYAAFKDESLITCEPTHWMILPVPPKPQEAN